MARLRLLGGLVEDIPCTVISAEPQEDPWVVARRLRHEAQQLHVAWLTAPGDVQARHSFAEALLRWGEFVGEWPAVGQARALLALDGLPDEQAREVLIRMRAEEVH